MVRAHRDLPKPKETKDLTPLFDLSEQGVPYSGTEVASKEAGVESKPPVPEDAKRPKRARKPKAVIVEEEAEPVAFPEGMKGMERPLSMEVRDLNDVFENARADFETVADAVDRRMKQIREELGRGNLSVENLGAWSEHIAKREGLQEKFDAAMDKMVAARKAYIEAYEKWEQKLASDAQAKLEMEKTIDQLIKENPSQAAQETAEETMWYDRGEKAWKESDQIAEVRQQIAGNEPEQPVGTPSDLSVLGFDQVFIDAYKETRERLEKAEAAKGKAGFFKKLFGGAKIERDYESARSDFEAMQEDVMTRRMDRERALRESDMTPAEREAARKNDEHRLKRVAERGNLP